MAGYEPPIRTATLVFEDGDLKGLELEARLNIPFSTLYRLMSAVSTTQTDVDDVRDVLTVFAEQCLISWNLEKDGQSVPCTAQNLLDTFDPQAAGTMLLRYIGGVGELSGPLARRRGVGRTSASGRAKPRPRKSSKPS